MKIIADTHIYYYLGSNESLFDKVKWEPIYPTFINILELSKTHNLINRQEYVREAIRKLFNYKNEVIFEPPFIHVAKLYGEYDYDPWEQFGNFLMFTEEFAGGKMIDENKTLDFIEWAEKIQQAFKKSADFANNTVQDIKSRMTSKKEHRQKDTLQLTMHFINHFVKGNTNGQCDLEGLDLAPIELLVKTVDVYFKTLELSQMKMQANDWFDFAILAYVQPGDKFWTREKRWLTLINEAGCSDYLIDFNNV